MGTTTLNTEIISEYEGFEDFRTINFPDEYNTPPWKVIIGEGWKIIAARTFYDLNEGPFLVEVVFPPTLTEIGEEAFADCPLTGPITFPPSLTTIGEGAFN